MLGGMATTKAGGGKTAGGRATSGGRKAPAKAPTKPTEAPASTLAEIGREAQRKALLAELERQDWNLTATARALGLVNASNVKRSLLTLGLENEYEAAKDAGKINPGRPTE